MMPTTTQMREARTPLRGLLRYRDDGDQFGTARWIDVSRVGTCVQLGRYVRPGRYVTLFLESPLVSNALLEVTARVMWCRQVQGGPEFLAGLLIRRDTPEMALDFAALGYRAQRDRDGFRRPAFEMETQPAAGALLPQAV